MPEGPILAPFLLNTRDQTAFYDCRSKLVGLSPVADLLIHGSPLVLSQGRIGGLYDFHGSQGIFCGDQEVFFSAYGFGKVINFAAESLNFIVAVTKDDPIAARRLTVLGLFPSDKDSPVRTVDIDVAVELFIDTPRKINSPHDTADAAHENMNRVLYCQP